MCVQTSAGSVDEQARGDVLEMDHPGQTSGWGERTDADLSSLLVELSRVAKAIAFYGPDDATTSSLAERACLAWQADLARAGPLELEVGQRGFLLNGIPGIFGSAQLGDVASGLERLGVQRVRFTEVLTPQSLTDFVTSLSELGEARRPSSQLGIEVDGEICVDLDSVGAPWADEEISLDPERMSLGSLLLSGARPILDEQEKPEAEGDPLAEPATGSGTALLLSALTQLDRCTDDAAYVQLALRVADTARSLWDGGLTLEASRAMLVLADHSGGEGGRSAAQARVARETLRDLAIGERLGELIDRACSNDAAASVRAAQVLLVVDDQAAPSLLDRLELEQEGPRAGQLIGLLIALGESAVPAVTAAITSGVPSRSRLGIRLAADLQCPQLVKPLRDLLFAEDGPLQQDAARALVEMGNAAALAILLNALESKDDRTAEIAAVSLGSLAAPRSQSALVRRLDRAGQERRWQLAREILRSIAQFHTGDRTTARALVAWVKSGGPPWRRPDLELKLEAITALGQLGGDACTAGLRELAGLRLPTRLRERVAGILERREDGRTGQR
jgi:hypothetical protein